MPGRKGNALFSGVDPLTRYKTRSPNVVVAAPRHRSIGLVGRHVRIDEAVTMARCSATLVESACCFAWVGSASRDVEVPMVLADSFGFRVARTD